MANFVCAFLCVSLCVRIVLCQFGFFQQPQRDERRYGGPFQLEKYFDPNRIRTTLTGILHLKPEDKYSNPGFILPVRRPGIENNNNGRPDYQYYDTQYGGYYQNYQNQYNYPQKPVKFPDNPQSNIPPVNFGQTYNTNTNGQTYFDYGEQFRPKNVDQEIPNDPVNFESKEVDPVKFVDNVPDSVMTVNNGENKDNSQSGLLNNQGQPQAIPEAPSSVFNNQGPPQEIPEAPSSVFNNQGPPQEIPEAPSSVFNNQGPPQEIPEAPSSVFNNQGPPQEITEAPSSIFNNQGPPQEIPEAPSSVFNNQGPPQKIPEAPSSVFNNQGPPQKIPEAPSSVFNNQGPPQKIPEAPSSVFNNQGPPQKIPEAPSSVFNNQGPPQEIPEASSDLPSTELPPLTPVPESEKRANLNFGSRGIFQETCQTVDNEIGSCITLYECEPYLKIVQQSGSSPAAVRLLRSAHCGFEGDTPKVCCPRPGIPTAPPTQATTTTTTEAPTPAPAPDKSNADLVSSLPEPPVCGVSNASFSRVIGGVNAHLGDFPWMALLGYKSKRGPGARWLCGGTLVTSRHVLTAAHCIYGHEDDLFLVRLGELDLEREDDGATPVDVLIKKMIKHENYDAKAFSNDIGVLVLDRDVRFTNLIKPICLPTDSDLRARSFENYNPIITGWGATELRGPSASHLQALQLPVVSNDFCAQAYSAYKQQKIDETVLCAGYKKGGKDACQGDSGGPLMQPIWNPSDYTTHFYQIGVVSYGKKCAEPGFPGVYSRVTYYVPWLEKQILGSP